MTDREDIEDREREFRRRWHQAHIERFEAEDDEGSWRDRNIAPHADEARGFLDALRRSRDLSAFQADTDRWARSFQSGYSGVAGQMIINQINKMSPDRDAAVAVLVDALSTPVALDDAVRKIRLLADHLQDIRVGAHPPPKRAPFVASYYWGLDNPDAWPVAWPKSTDYLAYCTGRSEYEDQGGRYAELYHFATEFDGDPLRFERVASWWADERPVVVDDVLCDRAALREGARQRGEDPELYRDNAQALVAAAQHIGTSLAGDVAEAAGRTLKPHKPSLMWDKNWPRGDLWVDWRVPGSYGLAVRLWLNGRGLAIGLRPYPNADAGATEGAVGRIESRPLPGYEVLAGGRSRLGKDVGFVGGGAGEVIYARWFDRDLVASLDVSAEVLQAASDVGPLIADLNGDAAISQEGDELAELVNESTNGAAHPMPGDELDVIDRLEGLAEKLLVDRAFLDDVVALLEDKKQIVFYGPPGTGKTYFAMKLAEALVPDAERRRVVQFHPSTSYEDFVEGYRPETDADGVMTYRLQRGPLAELAARASDAPGRRHVMIIDEINRANLPKVLGEMLFLLEYRDTPVRTLYRPDDPFELSKDIWFIGTMNTADRSIALVDAALRRRFHFVPFFPNHGPMAGLLDRWLEREGEPAWVGELVAQVNDELEQALGGPHLQLGPSHFMKRDLDPDTLRRIWEYNIEPFIEDQFFGDTARIHQFRFPQVWERFSELAGESISEDSAGDEPESPVA